MTIFTYHTLDFSLPAPLQAAVCRRCDSFVTMAEWVDTTCPGVPCRCGHGEASHHNLDHCTHEDCPCRRYVPAEEEMP